MLLLALGLGLLLGPVCGVLWALLAPDVFAEVDAAGVRLPAVQAQRLFAVEAVFVVVTGLAGLLLGLALAPRWLSRPGALLAGLVCGGLLGSVTAWRVGVLLGPGAVEPRLAAAAEGERVPLPLGLEAYGALLVWPITAVAAVLVVLAVLPADGEPVSRGGRSGPSSPG